MSMPLRPGFACDRAVHVRHVGREPYEIAGLQSLGRLPGTGLDGAAEDEIADGIISFGAAGKDIAQFTAGQARKDVN